MSQLKTNSNWDALLHGRTFELRVPIPLETCIARLEKQAAGEATLGLRFSKVNEALYEFELRSLQGKSEVMGRGRLEAIENGHTLIGGGIGFSTIVPDAVIAICLLAGLGLLVWLGSLNISDGLGWVYGVFIVVVGLVLFVARLGFFDARLRWMQEALD